MTRLVPSVRTYHRFSRLATTIAAADVANAIHRMTEDDDQGASSTAIRTNPADGVAEAIRPHVDDRLGALLVGRNRGVEQLIASAEPRRAEDRFSRPRCREAPECGRNQTAKAARQESDRRRADSQRESESLERDTAGHRLKRERDEADCSIIKSEEAHERIAGSDRLYRLRLEHIVESALVIEGTRHEMPQM
jgi:hypothetical protein